MPLVLKFTEKPLDVVNKSPNQGPSIMKKRGYENTNGMDIGWWKIFVCFDLALLIYQYLIDYKLINW